MSGTDDFGRSLPIGSHHYRAYVGPPEKYDLVAAMQFNLLTHLGLREFHYLLDVGCGSLRAGRLFIPYLLPGHYYGIEPEAWLIEEGIKKELGRDILQIKQPIFSYDSNFNCVHFSQKFDFVVAQSVFSHAAQLQIQECLSQVGKCLQPNGVMAATFVEGTADYQGEEWIYPDCVTYTVKQMKRIAAACGLTAETIDWSHPNGQTWFLITHPISKKKRSFPPTEMDYKSSEVATSDSGIANNAMSGPICIIGMHRSGTSMIANLLRSCGLSLGPDENLLGVNESNPFGHFEHIGFLKINEALLRHLGGSWNNPPHLHQGWEQDPALDELTSEARLLINDFADCNTWGWKDPRTTILLQFWQKIIPNLRYVICIRNPLEVALSLAQRDGVSISAAAHLWRQYVCQAIQRTEGHSRILTFYEDYFRQPIQEVKRVSEFCGLRNDEDFSKIQENISGELRHQIGGTMELLNERSVSIEDKMLYFSLRTLRLDKSCVIDQNDSAKTRVRDGLSSVLRLFSELHDQEKMLQLETAAGEKEHELNAIRMLMREESRKKDEQIARLQDHNTRLQVFADTVRQTVAYRLYRTFLKLFRGADVSQKT